MTIGLFSGLILGFVTNFLVFYNDVQDIGTSLLFAFPQGVYAFGGVICVTYAVSRIKSLTRESISWGKVLLSVLFFGGLTFVSEGGGLV